MVDWMKQYWLGALFATISAAVTKMWVRQRAINKGILALLHSELYKECEACEQKGYATVDDLKNIEYIYEPYHALGGNGTGTVLYERVKSLPPEPVKGEITA
ncbi:MAG: DUF1043 domain-containing protein [Eubacteriales bacterium]|jgi:hypothetical protein